MKFRCRFGYFVIRFYIFHAQNKCGTWKVVQDRKPLYNLLNTFISSIQILPK